ncbi:MAG: hypothetical protein K8F90_17580 [Hyphomicrobiales bacterium]|nr:hypothetical protein [Hyphomicrobiales bacterium]
MAKLESERIAISKLVDTALSSGIVDRKASIEDIVKKFGSDVDQVAGYVAAWERYVIVVAMNSDEVVIKR